MTKKIYISGMHSGQNPCSGVGIARCLRKAFPSITLVGVDHWQGSSGLHDAALDEVLLLPQWKQINDDRHAAQLRSLLEEGNLWISALDMEVHWISENVGRHQGMLAPDNSALEFTAKPEVKAINGLQFGVPEFIPANLSDSDVHSFLRHSSWQCWLKSPYHDAKRISSWGAFERHRETMSKDWKTSKLFLQRHVAGNEETIAFSAYQGELLAATHLVKRQLTPEGKTWAGHVTPVDPEFFAQFKEVIRKLEWSGGGEVEFVRDPDGKKWIIECNPRFPAWIFGAAISGMNLPARLVSHIWNLPLLEKISPYPFFTRVVQEIPANESVGIPLPPDPSSIEWSVDGKKGKGGAPLRGSQPKLNADVDQDEIEDEFPQLPERLATAFFIEIEKVAKAFADSPETNTPKRVHLENWAHARFLGLTNRLEASQANSPEIKIGYSVKTSPTDEYLRKAKKNGFYSECISQMEVHRALGFGFKSEQVILNGPGKFWPLNSPPVTGLHALYCDSIEEFERVVAIPGIAKCVGFRVRLPKLHSRFGNPIEDYDTFQRLLCSVRKLKGKAELGFHFHMPSWAIGMQRWSEAVQSLLLWCKTVRELSGVAVQHLDLGGGFFPPDLERLDFSRIQKLIRTSLPEVQTAYLEPGRALTQDCEVLVSRVLDVRRTPSPERELLEVVVDACVAELPLVHSYSHRVFYRPSEIKTKDGGFALLKKGKTRILGRICMEDDILSNGLDFPETVAIGDLVIFGDAGAYERTMSYDFGRG